MHYIKGLGIVAFLLLVIACFLPWIAVAGPNISAGGMDAGGTNFGKPGVLHLILGVLFLALHLIPRLWAKRVNVVVATEYCLGCPQLLSLLSAGAANVPTDCPVSG
ncbi:MAG: hypothetical protein IPM85_14415 [Chitinophagaceae bacterium]|nr:hypothetical protein [Chitinophagaceae bacterium]